MKSEDDMRNREEHPGKATAAEIGQNRLRMSSSLFILGMMLFGLGRTATVPTFLNPREEEAMKTHL